MGWFSKLLGRDAPQTCLVHVLDPNLDRLKIITWTIGTDVPRETYKNFKAKNGHLFVVVTYENGIPSTFVLQQEVWQQISREFHSIDKEGQKFTRNLEDKLRQIDGRQH